MIARVWHGTTLEENADSYQEYLARTGARDCLKTPGNRGVLVLRRIKDAKAEFLFVSFWESFDAIRGFAGGDIEHVVYYPEDKSFLTELEPTVSHFEAAFFA